MSKLIKFQDLTPEVYYKKSRDFQLIGRLFDLVLNNAKMNIDTISALPLSEDMDSRLLDLLTTTLGFKSKHEYNVKQLAALCSVFAFVLRNKGSKLAIETACNALLNAEGIKEKASVEIDSENYTVSIFMPSELSDLNLLKDLLNYILPAGMSCSLIKEAMITVPDAMTDIGYTGNIWYNKEDFDSVKKISSILEQGADTVSNASRIKNNKGVFMNSNILKQTPEKDKDNNGGTK